MIELTMTLIPEGQRQQARVIARGTITYVGGSPELGNYRVCFSGLGEPEKMEYRGIVRDFKRSQSPWHLLLLALAITVGKSLIRPPRRPVRTRA